MEETQLSTAPRRAVAAVWVGFLGPPVALLLEMETVYALTPLACRTGWHLLLHVPVVLFLALTVGSGLVALHVRRSEGGGWPASGDQGGTVSLQFLSLLGLMSSGFFSLVLIAHWIMILSFDPCDGIRL